MINMSAGSMRANNRATRVGVREVVVGNLEARLFMLCTHEGADHSNAGEVLAENFVDAVDLDLHGAEEWQRPLTIKEPITIAMSGMMINNKADNCRLSRTARKMPPMAVNGASTIIVRPISTSIWTCWTSLVLVGNQRRRAELVDLMQGERLDLSEHRGTHVSTKFA